MDANEFEPRRARPALPGCSEYKGDIFHRLFAVDAEEDNVRIVTAYRPNPEEWEEDCKTKKHSS